MIPSPASRLESTTKKVGRKLSVFDNDKDLANFMAGNLLESLKQMIRLIVNTIVREEMDKFRSEIDDKIYFNGSYNRQMISTLGKVDNVPVPDSEAIAVVLFLNHYQCLILSRNGLSNWWNKCT